ncbi:MAG: hypothetical protein WBO94_13355, partial [Nitrospira sp.]
MSRKPVLLRKQMAERGTVFTGKFPELLFSYRFLVAKVTIDRPAELIVKAADRGEHMRARKGALE